MQNVINSYTLSFLIVTVFALAAYLIHIFKKKQGLNIIPILASIATVYLIYGLISVPGSVNYYNILALDMCIAILSTILAILYISKPYIFVGLVILLIAGFLIYINANAASTAFAGMFGIGTIYGMLYREFVLSPKKSSETKKAKKTEINRDVVQILLGIVLVGIMLVLPYMSAVYVIFALILLAYTSNNLVANLKMGKFYTRTMDLERKGATYGQGATYLAAGTALIMGFAAGSNFLLFGIAVLFFADSLATIVGISAKRAEPLPYNRYKTIIGTFMFFVIAAIAGYLIIGLVGILFALILAFIEGLNLSIDDNVRTGVVIVVLKALTGI